MENFTSEGLLVLLSILGFSLVFGLVFTLIPNLVDLVIKSLEVGVM